MNTLSNLWGNSETEPATWGRTELFAEMQHSGRQPLQNSHSWWNGKEAGVRPLPVVRLILQ